MELPKKVARLVDAYAGSSEHHIRYGQYRNGILLCLLGIAVTLAIMAACILFMVGAGLGVWFNTIMGVICFALGLFFLVMIGTRLVDHCFRRGKERQAQDAEVIFRLRHGRDIQVTLTGSHYFEVSGDAWHFSGPTISYVKRARVYSYGARPETT